MQLTPESLRAARTEVRITLAQLAAESGLHLTAIAHIEAGRLPLTRQRAHRLAAALRRLVAARIAAASRHLMVGAS